MRTRLALAALLTVLAGALAACAQPSTPSPAPEPMPPAQTAPDSPATGSSLAPGLYDLDNGTVQALGVLEYRNLEGGFWAIIDTTAAAGDAGKVAAVIANGKDFEPRLKALEGKSVTATGSRLDGASIRMAGPEIEVTDITEVTNTGGPAQ